MTENTQKRPNDANDDVYEYIRVAATIMPESLRGAILVAAAYVEEKLEVLISAHFVIEAVGSKTKRNLLFDGNAPLASFANKIRVAWACGHISTEEFNRLGWIKAIRNDFAHGIFTATPEEQTIRDYLKNLRCGLPEIVQREISSDPRAIYIVSALWLGANFAARSKEIKRAVEPTSGPNYDEIIRFVHEYKSEHPGDDATSDEILEAVSKTAAKFQSAGLTPAVQGEADAASLQSAKVDSIQSADFDVE